MTILQTLAEIYKRFEKSIDAPELGSEDFGVRLAYANQAIRKWASEIGMDWKELYGTLSGSLTSGVYNDTTGLANFKQPSGFLRIGNDRYVYVRPERVEREQTLYPSKKIYTVTGSKGSHSINVYPAISDTFYLDYQKTPTTYVTGSETTEIEMSDPEFLISFVLSMLYLDDNNSTQAGVEMQAASGAMESMKLENEKKPFYQDNDEDDSFAGFGR